MIKQNAILRDYKSIVFWIVVLIGLYVTKIYSFLLFHSFAELFSIIIAFGIFMIAWNSRNYMDNDYLLFLGIAFLFVGIIDVLHYLSYKGMLIFRGYDADLGIQLWIAGRYLQAISFLLSYLFIKRKLNVYSVFSLYFILSALILSSIFYFDIFPNCFIEGKGLTNFKIISEYVICLILIASIVVLLKKKNTFDTYVVHLIVASIVINIASELCFTLYSDVYGFSNVIGHYFKVISFYLLYKAIIENSLIRPYATLFNSLQKSEERYRMIFNQSSLGIIQFDKNTIITDCNENFEKIIGGSRENIIGFNMLKQLQDQSIRTAVETALKGQTGYFEGDYLSVTGNKKTTIRAIYSQIKDYNNHFLGAIGIFEDITERKQLEQEREKLINELKDALANIKTLRGLLPICAHCKNIRNDKGYWEKIEKYIYDRSEADFSHSICPECMKKHYPEIYKTIELKEKYEKGEISEKDYEEAKKNIQQSIAK